MDSTARGLAALSDLRATHRARHPQSAPSCRRTARRRLHAPQAQQLAERVAHRGGMGTVFRWLILIPWVVLEHDWIRIEN